MPPTVRVICGLAGTGKSTLLASLICNETRPYVVLAATHAAVENIYGICVDTNECDRINHDCFKTLHSYFRIDFRNDIVLGPSPPYAHIIFIDEFSLINKHLFEICLTKAKDTEMVIMCGDPLQLNAIYDDSEENITFKALKEYPRGISPLTIEHHYLSVFGLDIVNSARKKILREIVRQDSNIKPILEKIFIEQDKNYPYEFISFDDVVKELIVGNATVLASKYSLLQVFYDKVGALDSRVDDIIEQGLRTKETTKETTMKGFLKRLYLYRGMEVMITDNGGNYYNGQRLYYHSREGKIAYCTETCVGDGRKIKIEPVFGSIIPITPTRLLSIHKSQGMTIDDVIIDIDDLFDAAMLYTAITRAKKRIRFYTSSENPVDTLFKNGYIDIHNELRQLFKC